MLPVHEEANKILDMPDRQQQIDYWKGLPDSIRFDVGSLVAIQRSAERLRAITGWRHEHLRKKHG